MKSRDYWVKRAAARSDVYLEDAEKTADEIGAQYFRAAKYFEDEIRSIFRAFKNAFKLSQEQAKAILKADISQKSVKQVLVSAANKISDEKEREEMLNALESTQAYQYRIRRIETVAKNAVLICNSLYNTELQTITQFLGAETEKAYLNTMFDLQSGIGVSTAFNVIPKSRIKTILQTNWCGKHYSKAVWGHTQNLADEIKKSMLKSMITGASESKAAADIVKRFGTSAYNARRLVRTETSYVANQAELDSYAEAGIEYYEYLAHIDERTSKLCRRLNKKIFSVKEAAPGINYPPMHAFCRSSTIAAMESLEKLEAEWNKEMAEILPKGVSFEEWLDGLQPTEDGKLVYTGRNADDSDICGSIKRTVKSAIKGEKVVSYDELPEAIRNNFEIGLKNSTTEARLAIKHELDTLDVCVNDNSKARFFSDVDLVQIRSDDEADTLAHEIFHRIDKKHKINKKNDLLSPLKNDWDALQIKAQGDVVTYLVSEYPTAFTVKNSGKVVLRKEYRGISDIISGLTDDKVNLGYHHNAKYWGKKNALQKEAWAQFGRVMYSNDPDVLKMFENLFTSFNESAIIALKDVI